MIKGENNNEGNKEFSENQDINEIYNRYYEDIENQKFNLWISICTEPRKTIRYIIKNQPTKYVVILFALNSVLTTLNKAASKNLGDDFSMWQIVLLVALLGGVAGILVLYLYSVLLKWTGKWLGGNSTTEHIRAAMAWPTIPHTVFSFLLIPQIMVFGMDLFTSDKSNIGSMGAFIIHNYFVVYNT